MQNIMATGQSRWGMVFLACVAALAILMWISQSKVGYTSKPQRPAGKPLVQAHHTARPAGKPLVQAHHTARPAGKPLVQAHRTTKLLKHSSHSLLNAVKTAAKVGIVARLGVVKKLFGNHNPSAPPRTVRPRVRSGLRSIALKDMQNVTSPPPSLPPLIPKSSLLASVPPKQLYNPSGKYGSNPYVKEIGISTAGSWTSSAASAGNTLGGTCPPGSHIANVQAWYTGDTMAALNITCDDGPPPSWYAGASTPGTNFATWDFNNKKSSGVNMYFKDSQKGPFNALGFFQQDVTLDNLQEMANKCISSDDILSTERCKNVYQNVIVNPAGESGLNSGGNFDYTNMGWGMYGPGALITNDLSSTSNQTYYFNTPNVMICKPNTYLNGVKYTTGAGGGINSIKWTCG